MRRAVIFVTLALLLLAVAGVTVAQEGVFRENEPAATTSEATTPEATLPGSTVPEASAPGNTFPEATSPESTVPEPAEPDPDALEETASLRKPEPQEATEPEKLEPEQPDNGRGVSQKPPKAKPAGGPREKDKPEAERDDNGTEEVEDDTVRGDQQKITLYHKGKATISVGAPAQRAHSRHGDALGAHASPEAPRAREEASWRRPASRTDPAGDRPRAKGAPKASGSRMVSGRNRPAAPGAGGMAAVEAIGYAAGCLP